MAKGFLNACCILLALLLFLAGLWPLGLVALGALLFAEEQEHQTHEAFNRGDRGSGWAWVIIGALIGLAAIIIIGSGLAAVGSDPGSLQQTAATTDSNVRALMRLADYLSTGK